MFKKTTLEEIQYHIVNNTKFTNINIIEYVRKIRRNNRTEHIVKCKCDCGRIFETRYNDIKSGKTKSCGNCNLLDGCNTVEEEIQYHIVNNTKFTNINIVEYVRKIRKKSTEHIVKCKCDCGRIFETRYNDIKSGKTKSCGNCNLLDGCNTVEEEIQYHIDNKTIFTYITIIEYIGKDTASRRHIVKCKCVCGRIFETRYNNIKSGKTKSCGNCNLLDGCNTVEEEIHYHIDNNTKFTNINIVEYVRKIRRNNRTEHIVKCKCDCGRIFETRYSSIKTGTTKSCGNCNLIEGCNTVEEEIHYHIDNKTKFTYITIIEYVRKIRRNNRTEHIVKCKCDCGRIFETRYNDIKSGKTKSCGCSLSGSSFAEKELGRYLHSIIKETRYIETEEKQLRLYYNSNKNYFSYDIVVPYNNKNYIIEYNGRPWHPKSPNQLDKNGNPWKKPHSDESAEYWYYYDQKKKQVAIDNGYEYIVVWDDEPREVVLKRIFETIGYSESNKRHNLTIDDFF